MTARLDLDFVRAQFPAFAEPSLAGQAFFENAGGSYACAPVIDRLTRYYRETKVQPYAPYPASARAGAGMDEARARLAGLMGVETDELMFGPSTSQNTYVLARAFAGWLAPGDAIVVTDQDHEANSGVWRRLGSEGIEVREWRVDPVSGHLDPAALPALLDGAKLLAFPHCSNIVGEVNPVAEIVALAHAAGAVTCVDGVSYAPHGLPDVGALGTDIYLFSAYKTYGPHQGIMVVRRALRDALPNQGHFFNDGVAAKRLTPAGPDHAQIAACAGIADYVDAVDAHHFGADPVAPRARAARVLALQAAHEARLLQPLLDFVAGRNDVRLIGPATATRRVPTVALALDRPGEAVAAALAAHGIMAGGGHFYAVRVLRALGIDPEVGVLRLSFVHYTHPDEVGRLIEALKTEL
ncbi:MAG: nitrogen fixation protein NifS [Rhodovulum sulfidophilum]|uniref:Nitrogen fixation protein NifS n=1 Tax=Rhodovulum sulfidophilum TaxID=35806 RepID=A0A2W5PZH1_RHOSU|nr:MAG: nitrogen fixation protein NifS [Rhodovulum sulfidophilum]